MARTLRTVAEGIYFGEGPRWRDGRLWFSDFYAHCVYSVSETGGDLRKELELDDQPSGLGWMPDGSLLVVKMKARELWRRWPDGRFDCHADLKDVSGHMCNDMVVDGEGRAYVGNFGFDLDAEFRARGPKDVIEHHPTTGLALVQPDGSVSIAAPDLGFPNGTMITPDGKTLIIGETLGRRLTAFDIGDGGALSNRRLWADASPRMPDGACLDAEGAVWMANAAANECVRYAEGGEVLEVVETSDLNCYACMLGGADGKTLFLVVAPASAPDSASRKASGKIMATSVDVPHAGWP